MTNAKVMVDTNVLVYAFTALAPFHGEARAMLRQLEAQDAELWINRQIVREYVATLTRPQSYTSPVGVDTVVEQVNVILHSFNVADDTALITGHLLALLREIPVGGKQVHDANVVATMLAYDIDSLLTHNVEDFRRFQSKITLIPLVEDTSS